MFQFVLASCDQCYKTFFVRILENLDFPFNWNKINEWAIWKTINCFKAYFAWRIAFCFYFVCKFEHLKKLFSISKFCVNTDFIPKSFKTPTTEIFFWPGQTDSDEICEEINWWQNVWFRHRPIVHLPSREDAMKIDWLHIIVPVGLLWPILLTILIIIYDFIAALTRKLTRVIL